MGTSAKQRALKAQRIERKEAAEAFADSGCGESKHSLYLSMADEDYNNLKGKLHIEYSGCLLCNLPPLIVDQNGRVID